MITFLRAAIGTLFAIASVMPSLAYADPGTATSSHVRTRDAQILQALQAAYAASPTFRALADIIEGSDVVVYLEIERCRSGRLRSCLYLGPCKSQVRYLRIKIDPATPSGAIPALLGHELQHVAEVVSRPDVRDGESFVRLFLTIGFPCSPGGLKDCFETLGAQLIERAVASEMNGLPTSSPLTTADINANHHSLAKP